MESLVRKYFDGELNEDEAEEFLQALAENPAMSREVEELEKVVAKVRVPPLVSVTHHFADSIMTTIESSSGRTDSIVSRNHFRGNFSLAASLALALGLGYVLASGLPGVGPVREMSAEKGLRASVSDAARPALPVDSASFQVTRLVYASAGRDIRRVGVAGSFNNWDPSKTPMRLENGVWVAMLMLPPDSYEYMFVEDNTTWVTDPMALSTRDDGFGSRNAVLEIGI